MQFTWRFALTRDGSNLSYGSLVACDRIPTSIGLIFVRIVHFLKYHPLTGCSAAQGDVRTGTSSCVCSIRHRRLTPQVRGAGGSRSRSEPAPWQGSLEAQGEAQTGSGNDGAPCAAEGSAGDAAVCIAQACPRVASATGACCSTNVSFCRTLNVGMAYSFRWKLTRPYHCFPGMLARLRGCPAESPSRASPPSRHRGEVPFGEHPWEVPLGEHPGDRFRGGVRCPVAGPLGRPNRPVPKPGTGHRGGARVRPQGTRQAQ
jgi:hypothetical protein